MYIEKIFVGLDEIKFGKLIEWGYFNKFLSYGKIWLIKRGYKDIVLLIICIL